MLLQSFKYQTTVLAYEAQKEKLSQTTGWFGIRREFCQFLLAACPTLREYGNVTYRFSAPSPPAPPGDAPRPSAPSCDRAGAAAARPPPVQALVLPAPIDLPD